MEDNEKEEIRDAIVAIKNVDLAILEAYKKMPKEFQDKLSFDVFYNFHRNRLEELVKSEQSEELLESLTQTSDKIEEKIPEEELCKKCSKERHAWDDPDFCIKCRGVLREEAQNRTLEIKEELLKDTDFIALTNADAAKAYVNKKYHNVKNTNKYIALTAIAKEAYQLKKMQKGI